MGTNKKAIIIYLSRKGTTKYYAHNIGNYLKDNNIAVQVKSMHDVKPEEVNSFDYILLGCWTHGLFVILQHPEKQWVQFAKKLPDMTKSKVGLFTTYKIATGSMFKRMIKALNGKTNRIDFHLKAKGEELSGPDKQKILEFIT